MAQVYVKRAELSVSHFYNSDHWKRALKIIFNGSWCFQFPEAVIISTVKEEGLHSTDRGSLQVVAVW